MPNLVPPVVTGAEAAPIATASAPPCPGGDFTPLMTLYLTETTDPADVARRPCRRARHGGQALPGRGDHQFGLGRARFRPVRRCSRRWPRRAAALRAWRGDRPDIDIFDREAVFIDRVLDPIRRAVPGLRVVMEHVTTPTPWTMCAAPGDLAATITTIT
jgi:dihydroorotase